MKNPLSLLLNIKLGSKVYIAQIRKVIPNQDGNVAILTNNESFKKSLQSIHYRTLRRVITIGAVCTYGFFLLGILASNDSKAYAESELYRDSSPLSPGYTSIYPLNVKLTKLTFRVSKHNWDFRKLAEAIRLAEGIHSKHPYGILKTYRHTSPKQACLNTIYSAYRRYQSDDLGLDFISFLQRSYAPLNVKNDPSGLNVNWIKNVNYFYNKGEIL